jgi:DNA-directed RNA polymerase subunit RPC12/RpoP
MNDSLDDFIGFDFAMGADEAKCPHCGEKVFCSLLMNEDEIDCPKCGMKFKKTKS